MAFTAFRHFLDGLLLHLNLVAADLMHLQLGLDVLQVLEDGLYLHHQVVAGEVELVALFWAQVWSTLVMDLFQKAAVLVLDGHQVY